MGTEFRDLQGTEAKERIRMMVEANPMCVMITSLEQRPFRIRPMAMQKVDAEGRIYFFSRRTSEKNMDLHRSDEMHLIFSEESKSEYLSLYGHAAVYHDQAEIDEMYSKFVNTWFDGPEDPNITIIRFEPEAGHYWDTKNGKLVALAGMVFGAITGKETDNSVEGDLKT